MKSTSIKAFPQNVARGEKIEMVYEVEIGLMKWEGFVDWKGSHHRR